MTRILLALLLTTPLGCFSLPSQAELAALGAGHGLAIEASFTLAFASVGLDIRWALVPGGPLGERAGDGTNVRARPVLSAGDKPHDDSYP